MIPIVKLEEVISHEGIKTGYDLLTAEHGCVNGSKCGVSIYRTHELKAPTSHEDQEGFFVLEGHGRALVGSDEFDLEPGMCFMVPAHTPHAMCCAKSAECCKVFWFHAAV